MTATDRINDLLAAIEFNELFAAIDKLEAAEAKMREVYLGSPEGRDIWGAVDAWRRAEREWKAAEARVAMRTT